MAFLAEGAGPPASAIQLSHQPTVSMRVIQNSPQLRWEFNGVLQALKYREAML
jgi:hypothetical protein